MFEIVYLVTFFVLFVLLFRCPFLDLFYLPFYSEPLQTSVNKQNQLQNE